MPLVVHLLIGYRRLPDPRYNQDDPMVHRLLGLKRLQNVAIVSRTRGSLDKSAVWESRTLSRSLALERLEALAPPRLTFDFDDSVLGMTHMHEGIPIGYNTDNGQRNY